MALRGTGSSVDGWGRPLLFTSADYPTTIAGWYKAPTGNASLGLFGLGGANAMTFLWYLGLDDDSTFGNIWILDGYDDTGTDARWSGAVPATGPINNDGNWHHIGGQFLSNHTNPSGGKVGRLWIDGVDQSWDTSGLDSLLGTQTLTSLQIGVAPTDGSMPIFPTTAAVAEVCVFAPGSLGYDMNDTMQRLARGANPLRTPGAAHLRAYHPLRGSLRDYSSQRLGLREIGTPGDPVWVNHPPVDPIPSFRRPLVVHLAAVLTAAATSTDSAAAALTTAIKLAASAVSTDSATANMLASSLSASVVSHDLAAATLIAATHLEAAAQSFDSATAALFGSAIPLTAGAGSVNSAIAALTIPSIAANTQQLQNALVDTLMRGQPFLTPSTWYLALVTRLGSTTQPGIEVSGGSYARVAVGATLVAWAGTQAPGSTIASNGTSGLVSNNADILFPAPTADWGTVVGYEFWDAPTSGNRWISGKLTTALTIRNADPARKFPIAGLSVQLV